MWKFQILIYLMLAGAMVAFAIVTVVEHLQK